MTDFRIGDSAQLKSGGPKMLVVKVTETGMVMCTWPYDGGSASYTFSPLTIQKYDPAIDSSLETDNVPER